MTDKVLCSKCQSDDVIGYMTPQTAVCPACCDDHDFEYCHPDRKHYCTKCSDEPPDDWFYYDDDVPLYGAPHEAGGPFGTPASAMDGNAANRHNNPSGWDNWVAFCNSWGQP